MSEHDLHETGVLRIAVASDLHAYPHSAGSSGPSHLKILAASDSESIDPLRHLSRLIASQGIKADVLLSPGDLGDKASAEGIQYAWKSLHEIGRELQAHLVTASSGNHDLDSRHNGCSADPAEVLQRLAPSYPLPDDLDNDKYWSRKFVIKQTEHYKLIILNSAAYHGGKPEEIEHGRVSIFTIKRLEKELSLLPYTPVNIILCHHHPHQFPELFQEDDTYDVMKNGQYLLDLLGNGRNGNWIVIHGHKHHARVGYSQGTNSSPFVMAAGSFSAVIYPELQSLARNQFYIIELPLNNPAGFVGTIRAWDWTPGGWISAGSGSGLPAISKFGCRDSPANLARRVDLRLGARATENWGEILNDVPEVEFLLSSDFATLVFLLERDYKIKVVFDQGTPRELGRVGGL